MFPGFCSQELAFFRLLTRNAAHLRLCVHGSIAV
jgi:hypothetical protein